MRTYGYVAVAGSLWNSVPPGVLNFTDENASAGSHVYSLQASFSVSGVVGNGEVEVFNVKMKVYEL